MKALILVERLRLRHVLVRLPSKEFQAAVIQLSVTNLLYLPLFLPRIVVNH